ncbi:MAG: hypothetical protein IJ783_06780, partial [Kiritimatiellae bacterium]|nr:hypothetical protein [Kiritimatiellia bacterium]
AGDDGAWKEVPSIPEKDATLADDGAATAVFDLSAFVRRGGSPLVLVRTASAFEPGGRMVSATEKTVFHPWARYIAVRTGESRPGGDVRVELRLLRPDGAEGAAADAADGFGVRLALRSVKSESRLEKTDFGSWIWRASDVRKTVAETNVVLSGGAGAAQFRLPAAESRYEIVAEPVAESASDPCAATVHAFNTWGGGDGDDASPRRNRLKFSADKKSYAVGDVAAVSVEAPFAGEALVTVQGRGLFSRFRTRLEEGDNVLRIPLGPECAPSCEVAATLVRPAPLEARPAATDAPRPESRAWGAASLLVADPAARVAFNLGKPVVEPGADGTGWIVSAEASLAEGAAQDCDAKATFFLVDEALLDLTREPLPDPARRFCRARWSGAEVWDSWRRLADTATAPLMRTVAVGGDMLFKAKTAGRSAADLLAGRVGTIASRRFEPVVRVASDVPFEGGVARARFEIPDFAGRLRLVAVAWTKSAASAAKETSVVAPGLVAEADGPRFLAAGDVSRVLCTLHDNTAEPGTVELVFECDGKTLARRSVELPAGGSTTVEEAVSVPEDAGEGVMHVSFRATGFGETRVSSFELPVRPALPPETRTVSAIVAPGAEAVLATPADLVAGPSAAGTVEARPAADAMAVPALRWLAQYPWGCLEQTVSRALPLVWAQCALRPLSDDVCGNPGEGDARIHAAVARVGSLLRGDGSAFRVWPDSAWTDSGYSAWAGLFLAVAAQEGYAAPQSITRGSVGVLRRIAGGGVPGVDWRTSKADRERLERDYAPVRALALLGLAFAGEPDESAAMRMMDYAGSCPALARLRLAVTMFRTGHPREGFELLRGVEPDGSAETAAWGLLAWLEAPLGDGDPEL